MAKRKSKTQVKRASHPLAGQTVQLQGDALNDELKGQDYVIEDWWENVAGMSWMVAQGNPACLKYAVRSGLGGLPTDNEVVYGKVGGLGHLVHVSEIAGDE